METITVRVRLSFDTAVSQGRTDYGETSICATQGFLQGLSPAAKAILREYAGTTKALEVNSIDLDAAAKAIEAEAAVRHKQYEEKVAQIITQLDGMHYDTPVWAAIAGRLESTGETPNEAAIQVMYSSDRKPFSDPRVTAALEAKVLARMDEYRAIVAAKNAAEAAEQAARKAAEAEKEARQAAEREATRAAIRALIAEADHERYDAGVMPTHEIEDVLDAYFCRDFAKFAAYDSLKRADFEHDRSCTEERVSFDSYLATKYSASAWAAKKAWDERVQALNRRPGITAEGQVKVHRMRCEDGECPEVTKMGYRVKGKVYGYVFVHEYELEQG